MRQLRQSAEEAQRLAWYASEASFEEDLLLWERCCYEDDLAVAGSLDRQIARLSELGGFSVVRVKSYEEDIHNPYRRLREELGMDYPDEDYVDEMEDTFT